MARFSRVVFALIQGQSVRRNHWLPDVQMFLQGDALMYQDGTMKPWRCALSWDEIAANDWELLNIVPVALQANQISTERLPLLLIEELALPRSFEQMRTQVNLQPSSFHSKAG
jgi:hypothetical protein